MNLGQARDRTQQNVFDAWLFRRGDGNAIAVATETRCDPENVNIRDGGSFGDAAYLFSHEILLQP
jgi:hypothetical protein